MRTRVPYHTTWTTSKGGVVAKWDCDDIVTHTRAARHDTEPYKADAPPEANNVRSVRLFGLYPVHWLALGQADWIRW